MAACGLCNGSWPVPEAVEEVSLGRIVADAGRVVTSAGRPVPPLELGVVLDLLLEVAVDCTVGLGVDRGVLGEVERS